MKLARWSSILPPLLLAGCAGRQHAVAVVAAPAPAPVVEVAPLPPGASPGMAVPQPLADGSFPTPNRRLSAAGTLWHLRAALNVAALSCPGAEGETIRVGYNAWLKRDRRALATAVTDYAAEYRGAPPAAGFDEVMTRLYNFWSQTPVRAAFCAAAADAMARVGASDAATLTTDAGDDLATLDRPFTDFYRAYDAWRRGAAVPIGNAVIATVAPSPTGPAAAPRPTALTLDLSTLPVDDAVVGGVSAR